MNYPLASLARPSYLELMKMFRTDGGDDDRNPRDHLGGIADLWNYLKEDKPHKWTSMVLAITITGVVIWTVYRSLIQPDPPATIIYVESWPLTRSDAEVAADWKERAIEANERNAKRRAAYRGVADALGIDYDKAPGTEGGPPLEGAPPAKSATPAQKAPTPAAQ